MRVRDQDLVGQVFGRWTVLSFGEVRAKARMWNCRCTCGSERQIPTRALRKGRSLSCGCFAIEVRSENGKARKTHGRTPEYRAWCAMKVRCYTRARGSWADYGGRGIAVCDRWRGSFDAFLQDLGPRPSNSHSLDRLRVNEDYSPDNCRWATREEQANNKRSNVFVLVDGERMTIAEGARRKGIGYGTFYDKVKCGVYQRVAT